MPRVDASRSADAGGSGLGAFEAAVDAGDPGEVWAIGVDSDQYNLVSEELQPYILTSMLKLVDVATYNTIEAYVNGSFTGGIWAFLADGAMSKRYHTGRAAEIGVTAAYMARAGFEASKDVLNTKKADWSIASLHRSAALPWMGVLAAMRSG